MTSSEPLPPDLGRVPPTRGKAPRTNPVPWSWQSAGHLLFDHSTPADRLLSTDLGQPRSMEELQQLAMQQSLREAAEKTAQLLNEAGISLDDVKHLQAAPSKAVADELGGFL